MSVRDRMHPKNIYKQPPNFKELAILYPEFRKYVKQELSGRVTIDYQDLNAVKELTRTLLKKDFNLEVEIKESRLIPRVPLCFNYILWVEDLLSVLEIDNQPFGIDIGTGCACIYSLLAAKRGWKMLATELDPDNYKYAEKNVNQNNLENVISVKLVPDSRKLLVGVINSETKYDFCMCNPPFFDYNEKPQNRTSRRPQLETIASETPVEISTKGGEISFIERLIQESEKLKNQIKIFTTLVGKKSDFLLLKKEIQKFSPKTVTFTEFCQGRTTRWGLAWSFLDINLNINSNTDSKKLKKNRSKPMYFTLPDDKVGSLDEAFHITKNILNELKFNLSEDQSELGQMICFKAFENTWSHQRRKKRLKARGELPLEGNLEVQDQIQSFDNDHECSPKKAKLSSETEDSQKREHNVIVEGAILLRSVESSVVLEISWMSGNKEYLHQIYQYLKNHWSKVEINL